MEGCGDDALARTGGPRAPQPAVTHAPPSAALGQAMMAFRMLGPPPSLEPTARNLRESARIRKGPHATIGRPTAGWQPAG
jgi:hypothetical protein